MKTWKTRARRTILDLGKFLVVENHIVELPDGRVILEWPWVITPDYVNVLAVTQDGEFLCFRQTKYGVAGTSLAPVGGYLEAGEAPLAAARRELLEETGHVASGWNSLGSYRVDGNRGAGVAHLFLARGARLVGEPKAEDLEEQQLLRLSRSEIESALAAAEFKVLAWQTIVALGLLYLKADKICSREETVPEIKHFPKMPVAYVSEVGPFGEAVKRGFARLFAWLNANHMQPLGASLGIFYDDPAKVAPEKLRSELCVPVAPGVLGSGEVQVKEIGNVNVATIIYQGEQNIERAYNEVYGWLRAQGYRESAAPMETYLSKPGEELRAEIAVPIVKMVKPRVPKKSAPRAPKKPAKKAAKTKATKRK